MNIRFLSPSFLRLLMILALMAAGLSFPAQSVSAQPLLIDPVFTNCASATGMPQAECEALVALYNSAGGASWTNHTNWLVTSTPCNWSGVNCFGSHITQLTLSGNGLSGTIPPELGSLSELFYLSLFENQLSGTIPAELGTLSNLEELYLFTNQLSGSIPPELGDLTKLNYLLLDSNELSGSIPAELGSLSNLIYLNLNNNELSGLIPPEMGNLTNLARLWLDGNQLNGAFPASIANLVDLPSLKFDFCTGLGSTDPTVMAFLDVKAPGWNTCADIVISGDAGTAGASLSYIDGTLQNTLADANGLYSFEVPYFWSGIVTPAKAGYTFSPVTRSYTEVVDDQTGQDYNAVLSGIRKTFSSNNTQDGWVLANTVNNTAGGSFNSSDPTFRLGYDKNKRQYRGILSFKTSALPDNAVITRATLMIRAQAADQIPEKSSTGIIVDIKKGLLGTELLENTDFQVKANKSFEATYGPYTDSPPSAPPPGWINLDLTPGISFINKLDAGKGLTQFRLRMNSMYTYANYLSYYSGNAPLASRPRLVIQYYVP